jgi:hypothetical protein
MLGCFVGMKMEWQGTLKLSLVLTVFTLQSVTAVMFLDLAFDRAHVAFCMQVL